MVYCGRPSAACHACRQKRGKCDKKRPACGQCINKRTPCPGYRDPTAIIIRDQTSEVLDKARARSEERERRQGQKTTRVRSERPPSHESWQLDVSTPLTAATSTLHSTTAEVIPNGGIFSLGTSLGMSLQDAGTAFFLSTYVPTASMGYLSILADSCPTELLSSPSMLAPALAMLSHELMQPSLMVLARKNYLAAVRSINMALSSSRQATTDTILASVLLLALFETIAFHPYDSLNNWTSHVEGAVQLIKLRGPHQFESALGRALFLDVSNHIYASCVRLRIAVPVTISEMRAHLGGHIGEDSPEVSIGRVLDSMAHLLAQLASTDAEKPAPESVIAQGCQLLTQIDRVMEQLSKLCPYEAIPTAEAPECAFNGIAHKYATPQEARYWNILRVMKFSVNKLIHRAATALASGNPTPDKSGGFTDTLLDFATANAERVALEILGSIPFFQSLPPQSYLSQTIVRWLVWPLSAVAVSALVPKPAKAYARTRLEAFQDSRLPQVHEAVQMLDKKRALENW